MRQVFIEEEEKGDDYISRFGQHETWNDLYRMEDWQPHKMEEVELSEAVQRAHLSAFFADQYGLRYPVSPLLALDATMAMIRGSIQQLSAGSLWYRLQLGLKVRIVMRRFLQRKIEGRGPRESRERLLDGWLQYWREAEAKAWAAHRGHVNLSTAQRAAFGAPGAPPPSSAASLALVPDSVKARVLWELYWLLRAQTGRALTRHWQRWIGLLQQRRTLKEQPTQIESRDFLRFQPQTLAGVNAALFVTYLQEPCMPVVPGRQIRFAELVRLTLAPNIFTEGEAAVDHALRHVSPTLIAFLDSELCHDPEWFRERYTNQERLHLLVPPMAWKPPGLLLVDVSSLPTPTSPARGRNLSALQPQFSPGKQRFNLPAIDSPLGRRAGSAQSPLSPLAQSPTRTLSKTLLPSSVDVGRPSLSQGSPLRDRFSHPANAAGRNRPPPNASASVSSRLSPRAACLPQLPHHSQL
eukprot:GGOE01009918.1.p1 GENE.GGOE01009918.1~~GGOE01009918.1.p1  ORF type:complete len:466 (-),score=93.13 GGOE01009918.1:1869-3266(-)